MYGTMNIKFIPNMFVVNVFFYTPYAIIYMCYFLAFKYFIGYLPKSIHFLCATFFSSTAILNSSV
jgi:hypothetical protein